MKKIKANQLETLLDQNEILVVDYFATWCGPCQNYMKILDRIDIDEAKIVKLDIDENPEHVQEIGIQQIPTLRFFKNGKQIKLQSGVMRQSEIEDTLRGLIT